MARIKFAAKWTAVVVALTAALITTTVLSVLFLGPLGLLALLAVALFAVFWFIAPENS